MMGMMNDMLSEKTKAKLKNELVRICRSVMAVLLGEISGSLDSLSKDMTAKTRLSTKEDEAE